MIRFILVILTAFLYLILSIPVLLVLLLIRKKKPEVCDKVSRSLIRWIFRVILFFSGTKITVKGQENIPKDRAVLYIGNHRSYFDILVTYTTVPGSCGFVAKKELSRIPLLKNWMELIHCLFLDRSDIKQGLQMILSGCEEIKSGTSMSTPIVSGAVALLLERFPDMSNKDVKLRLRESSVDIGLPRNQQGWGLLDVGKMIGK